MSVAQGIRGPCGFDVILTFLPALCSQTNKGSPKFKFQNPKQYLNSNSQNQKYF